MTELMVALTKCRRCVGFKIDFLVLILTPTEERKSSNRASCLDCSARSQLWRYGIIVFPQHTGSDGESKGENSVLEML